MTITPTISGHCPRSSHRTRMRIKAAMAPSPHLQIARGCSLSHPRPVRVGKVWAASLSMSTVSSGSGARPSKPTGHTMSALGPLQAHSRPHLVASASTSAWDDIGLEYCPSAPSIRPSKGSSSPASVSSSSCASITTGLGTHPVATLDSRVGLLRIELHRALGDESRNVPEPDDSLRVLPASTGCLSDPLSEGCGVLALAKVGPRVGAEEPLHPATSRLLMHHDLWALRPHQVRKPHRDRPPGHCDCRVPPAAGARFAERTSGHEPGAFGPAAEGDALLRIETGDVGDLALSLLHPGSERLVEVLHRPASRVVPAGGVVPTFAGR
eukprot:3474994-Heterocapsa_arctica.AAC.2